MRKFLLKTTTSIFKWILLRLQPQEEVIHVDEIDNNILDLEMSPCPNCNTTALKKIPGHDSQEVYFLCGSVIILSKDGKIDKFIGGDECLVMGDKLIDITRGMEH